MDKAQAEAQHSQQMNQEALDRIKREAEMEFAEKAVFEDEEIITLRDGKKYAVPPLTLKNARILMKKLRTVQTDVIILNFIPSGDDEKDAEREQDLYDILLMAFTKYPEVTREYIDEKVDLVTARKIIDTLIGLNAIKK